GPQPPQPRHWRDDRHPPGRRSCHHFPREFRPGGPRPGREPAQARKRMIPWLADSAEFPPVERALDDPNGLLAAGGALTPEWLLAAYRRGIFPWYSGDQPILWWSPDPRLVLIPAQIKISRSLAKTLRQ